MSPFVQKLILGAASVGCAVGAYFLDGPSAAHLMTLAAGLGLGAGFIKRPGDKPAQ